LAITYETSSVHRNGSEQPKMPALTRGLVSFNMFVAVLNLTDERAAYIPIKDSSDPCECHSLLQAILAHYASCGEPRL
jgi:hypothetical protein